MFEDSLIESSRERAKKGPKKAISLPVSLTLHIIVLGALIGASIWFVEDVPEPPIPVTFYAAAPPPPPPPPAAPKAAPKPAEVQKPVPVRSTEMVAPTVMPEKIPEPLSAPEPESSGEGVEGGVEGGVPGGVLGGVVGGTGPGTGEGEPLRVGGDVKPPQVISKAEPTYPEAARKARMEGVVILEAIITAQGNVEDVKVLKSVNPLLDASAVRAVSQWRYKPATLNGRAVRVYLTVTITFNLH
jgi:periplasmic protein TonB